MKPLMHVLYAAVLAVVLAGCDKTEETIPPPAALSTDAAGYYCGMQVTEHAGPKGQIHIAGVAQPFWFTSVRDALAFTRLPEEPKNIVVIYVNDMGIADWDRPDDSSWIDARSAWYVVGSSRVGGMGGAEIVPFSTRAQADEFAVRYGGDVLRFDQIPDELVLGSAPVSSGTKAVISGPAD